MSTFKGVIEEFPEIRVDFFRANGRRPLACFLSHIHSDHLAGLENTNFNAPFVYCSAATKEFLLRLETYPHRMNFATGLLEARVQRFKHLKTLLKSIPLETPTQIELEPGNILQVTLLDANHCTGAVMFLFERDGNAVLYTGDIRSEPWFVNNLTRNPFLIEYTSGLKTLDCVYLDTSNTGPTKFPTKAEGLKELLEKVLKYPPDTVFHFTAWTFGYEEVWMALSKALKSPIHVDRYKMRLYQSLRGDYNDKDPKARVFLAHEAPVLAGYTCGNTPQIGCLTNDITVRLHSCEKGMHCSRITDKTVWIRPIIARNKFGVEIGEIGVGGGGGDLTQHPELELDDSDVIEQLLNLFENIEEPVMADVKRMLLEGLRSTKRAISLGDMGLDREEDELSLVHLTEAMARSLSQKRSASLTNSLEDGVHKGELPKVITFPYSRHSSYDELCHLVKVFAPKDVYPCTVDEENWHEGISMQSLFGHHCSTSKFRHDREMRELLEDRALGPSQQTHTTHSAPSSPVNPEQRSHPKRNISEPTVVRRNAHGRLRRFDADGRELALENITDEDLRYKVNQLRGIFPSLAVMMCRDALIACKGSFEDAVAVLSSPAYEAIRVSVINLVDNEVESSQPVKRFEPQMKRTLDDPAQSIRDKYSSTQAQSKEVYEAMHVPVINQVDNEVEMGTPPRNIAAVSPNSESQNLRRKAILEGVAAGSAKRARLQYDDPNSSPIPDFAETSQPRYQPSLGLPEHSESFDDVDTPGSEVDSDQNTTVVPAIPPYSAFHDETGREISYDFDELVPRRPYVISETFFDHDDGVTRCKLCGHEVWSNDAGFCTGCKAGDSGVPYFEFLDPDAGPQPEILANDLAPSDDVDSGHRGELIGEYLDNESSAYDSQDEDLEFHEEYELDSFIDDDSQEISDEEDAASSDGETDYKSKYTQLSTAHRSLQMSYNALAEEYTDLREEIFGSESDLDMDERDEDGLVVVDVSAPDPVVTELVLSQAQEQSQSSEIGGQRIWDRAVAFQAVSSEDGRGWHSISLVSARDNHSHEEVEL